MNDGILIDFMFYWGLVIVYVFGCLCMILLFLGSVYDFMIFGGCI